MKKTAYGGTKITDLANINEDDYKLKEKIKQRFFEVMSKNEDVIHTDLWFEDDKDDGGEDFPIKYVEFPDSIVKDDDN